MFIVRFKIVFSNIHFCVCRRPSVVVDIRDGKVRDQIVIRLLETYRVQLKVELFFASDFVDENEILFEKNSRVVFE